jgi:tetratricopeptide (TPR) repeat protein
MGNLYFVLFMLTLILGIPAIVSLRFHDVQLSALSMVGMSPTATPFASQFATWGEERFNTGDIKGALEMFQQAMQLKPDDVDYLYEYGSLLVEDDRIDEALAISERMIRVAPEDPRGYALKSQALMWSDPTEAILIAIQGADVDPNFAPLYAAMGVAYTNLGRWQEGIRNAQYALELDPTSIFVQVSYNFPMTYVGNYQAAIEALENAISINPYLISPYFYLALLYTLPGVNQPEMAIATYNHILELDPNNAKAYLRLCETYARVEEAQFDVAQPYCDTAIQIDPEYASAYRQRGQMQYNRRNYEGAIESFEKCIEYGSDEIECWYIRGLAHYFLGNCDQAWDVLQEARIMAQEQNIPQIIIDNIEIGLYNVTQSQYCAGYAGRSIPTPVPPTLIPPTPIGGFG